MYDISNLWPSMVKKSETPVQGIFLKMEVTMILASGYIMYIGGK